MKQALEQLRTHLAAVPGSHDALLPPATYGQLDSAQDVLGIRFPSDFRQLYLWRNGNEGERFLFGNYRVFPLDELLDTHKTEHRCTNEDWYHVSDDSGAFKDCAANRKWIQFADNGGNTAVFLDLDPGRKGRAGQILEACDGDIECRFSGIKEFIEDINERIASGELIWNEAAGGFEEADEQSIAERARFDNKMQLVDSSPTLHELLELETGDEVTLAGAIKPNLKSGKHELYLRGGSVPVTGDIGDLGAGLAGVPPLVKITLRAGKRSLFGFGAPAFEVISCEHVPQ